MKDKLLYYFARAMVWFLQSLSVETVAWLGRRGGALAWQLDRRHRRVALRNLTECFGGELSAAAIRALAREHLRRLGENYACAVKTASMTRLQLEDHVQIVGLKKLRPKSEFDAPRSIMVAIGHFGNFELLTHLSQCVEGYQGATTYRALNQPDLNRLLLDLRQKSGCLLFERRRESKALLTALARKPLLIGLLCDQHAGRGGVRIPFMGRECSTTAAPAVIALRYRLPLFTGICYRTGPGQWRVEAGDEIPTHEGERRRAVADIMRDVNQAFELAVRRDPANWFWVHDRWKPLRQQPQTQTAGPPASGANAPESPTTDHAA